MLCYIQFQDLEKRGYLEFAIGFYQESTQLVGTQITITSFSPPLIEYLHAVIVAGEEMNV